MLPGAALVSNAPRSSNIGHLLERDALKRVALVKRLKDIYSLRSKVVHGSKNVTATDVVLCQEALDVGIRVVATLLDERQDVLTAGDGAARSNLVLVHGASADTNNDES